MKTRKSLSIGSLIVLIFSLSSIILAFANIDNFENNLSKDEFMLKTLEHKVEDHILSINFDAQFQGKTVEFAEKPFITINNEDIETNKIKLKGSVLNMDFDIENIESNKVNLKIPSVVVPYKSNNIETEIQIDPQFSNEELNVKVNKNLNLNKEKWIKIGDIKTQKNRLGDKQILIKYKNISNSNVYPSKLNLEVDDDIFHGDVLTIFNKSGEVDRGVFVFNIPSINEINDISSYKLNVKEVFKKIDGNWNVEIPIK